MAQFSTANGAHVICAFTMLLSFGNFVAAQPYTYNEYVSDRKDGEELFDAMSLQHEMSLLAIKEVASTKKILDNMITRQHSGPGVLLRIQQDICDWLSSILGFEDRNCANFDISALEDMLEMRESAIRSVQDEVKTFVNQNRKSEIEKRKDTQCAWVNHRLLNDCTTASERNLTTEQNTAKRFFVDIKREKCRYDRRRKFNNRLLYICHAAQK